MSLLASSLLISPAATFIQTLLTRRLMSAIYEDLRASRTGFKLYYDESESRPLILPRHTAPYHRLRGVPAEYTQT
jgi:hypothetical protein